MIIREAVKADAAALKELVFQLGYNTDVAGIEQNIDRYAAVDGKVFVAEAEGEVLGFISGAPMPLFHAAEWLWRITALCVGAESRGRGIGKALVRHMEEHCKGLQFFYLELTSGAHRNDAHAFYQRLGYTVYEGRRFLKRL